MITRIVATKIVASSGPEGAPKYNATAFASLTSQYMMGTEKYSCARKNSDWNCLLKFRVQYNFSPYWSRVCNRPIYDSPLFFSYLSLTWVFIFTNMKGKLQMPSPVYAGLNTNLLACKEKQTRDATFYS